MTPIQEQQYQQANTQQAPHQSGTAPHIPQSELMAEQKQREIRDIEEDITACMAVITLLRQDLTILQEDLKKARDRGESLGPFYSQWQWLQNQIDDKDRELKNLQIKTGQITVKPDLTQRQVNIGGGAVGRNEAIANTSIVNS